MAEGEAAVVPTPDPPAAADEYEYTVVTPSEDAATKAEDPSAVAEPAAVEDVAVEALLPQRRRAASEDGSGGEGEEDDTFHDAAEQEDSTGGKEANGSAADGAKPETWETTDEVTPPPAEGDAPATDLAEAQDDGKPKPRQPYEVPTSGAFWLHDDRFAEPGSEAQPAKPPPQRKTRSDEVGRWEHDRFNVADEDDDADQGGYGYRGGRGVGRGRGRGRRGGGAPPPFTNSRGPPRFAPRDEPYVASAPPPASDFHANNSGATTDLPVDAEFVIATPPGSPGGRSAPEYAVASPPGANNRSSYAPRDDRGGRGERGEPQGRANAGSTGSRGPSTGSNSGPPPGSAGGGGSSGGRGSGGRGYGQGPRVPHGGPGPGSGPLGGRGAGRSQPGPWQETPGSAGSATGGRGGGGRGPMGGSGAPQYGGYGSGAPGPRRYTQMQGPGGRPAPPFRPGDMQAGRDSGSDSGMARGLSVAAEEYRPPRREQNAGRGRGGGGGGWGGGASGYTQTLSHSAQEHTEPPEDAEWHVSPSASPAPPPVQHAPPAAPATSNVSAVPGVGAPPSAEDMASFVRQFQAMMPYMQSFLTSQAALATQAQAPAAPPPAAAPPPSLHFAPPPAPSPPPRHPTPPPAAPPQPQQQAADMQQWIQQAMAHAMASGQTPEQAWATVQAYLAQVQQQQAAQYAQQYSAHQYGGVPVAASQPAAARGPVHGHNATLPPPPPPLLAPVAGQYQFDPPIDHNAGPQHGRRYSVRRG